MADDPSYLVPRRFPLRVYPSLSAYLERLSRYGPALKPGSLPEKLAAAKAASARAETASAARAEQEQQAQQQKKKQEEQEKAAAWVEVELVGMDDTPISGERYAVELPDGTRKEGRLDWNGRAKFSKLEEGKCKLSFPDLDQDAWDEAAAQPAQELAAPDRRPEVPAGQFAAAARGQETPEEKQESNWVEIELLGMDGKTPVAGERYVIVLPDGSRVEGTLDKNGLVAFPDLEKGKCKLSFPDLDQDAWDQAAAQPAQELAAPDRRPEVPAGQFAAAARGQETPEEKQESNWVEIELLGMDGKTPVAGERYVIVLPDGSRVEGTLDKNGLVAFPDLEKGKCKLSFPDLDQDAWDMEAAQAVSALASPDRRPER